MSVFLIISCSYQSEMTEKLSAVESIMEEHPDSALQVLNAIDTLQLKNRKDKALYALLLSQALDKNYIDTTNFNVLQPAIDYYKNHGTPTEKMKTLYYQGRIYANQGEKTMRMECYLKALEVGKESNDILTKARIYFSQANVYNALMKWEKYIDASLKAAEYFKVAGRQTSYVNSMNRVINGSILTKDYSSAEKYFSSLKSELSDVGVKAREEFYTLYLLYTIRIKSDYKIEEVLSEYKENIPQDKYNWLTLADAYYKLGDYQYAYNILSKYQLPILANDQIRYYLVLSDICNKLGRDKEALGAYLKYSHITDSIHLSIYKQDTQFIEERHSFEQQMVNEREVKHRMVLTSLLTVVISLLVIVWIRSRMKIIRLQKIQAEQEKQEYMNKYYEAKNEEENLKELLKQGQQMDAMSKTAVRDRLDILNRFFMANITENKLLSKNNQKKLEEMINNREQFINSTHKAFTGSHPKFIKYLVEHNLSEEEIGLCCLYALGLKGKEVGAYTNNSRHYKLCSVIREKLCIGEHETNLGNFIRKLLSEQE